MMPYLNPALPPNHRKDIIAEGISAFPLLTTQRMYRTGDWKYIFNYGGNDDLYNLTVDPYELNNLISLSEHEEILQSFRENLALRMKENNDLAAQFFCKYFGLLDYSSDGPNS